MEQWQTMLVSAYEKLDATANMAQIIESLLGRHQLLC